MLRLPAFPSERKRLYLLCAALAVSAALAAGVYLAGSFVDRDPAPQARLIRVTGGGVKGTLDAALKAEGLDDRTRAGIARALSRAKVDVRRLRPEDSYSVAFSTWGKLISFSLSSGLRNYSLFPDGRGVFQVTAFSAAVASSTRTASGIITASLWESMAARGVPPAVILDFADIFSWSVDFLTEVRDGDRWALAWEQAEAPGGRLVSQRIKAARYEGSETGRNTAAFSGGNYYDEKGGPLRSMFLRAPLHYRRISSYFTHKRFHPVLKYFRPHYGIDYAAPRGTPVSAVADGTVSFAGRKGGNGNLVMLRHAAGYESTYGHLSGYAKGVRAGRRVRQGDVIGYVGSTGLSSGPHLDFRIKLKGKPLNFLKIKYRSAGGVSGKSREAVRTAIQALP